jgi:hypothetical protein
MWLHKEAITTNEMATESCRKGSSAMQDRTEGSLRFYTLLMFNELFTAV